MLFVTEPVKNEELKEVQNIFVQVYTEVPAEVEEEQESTPVSQYITSLVTDCYQKSIEDIANTKVGNKVTRKKNFRQVMQESFFYGANRFGNNFIA